MYNALFLCLHQTFIWAIQKKFFVTRDQTVKKIMGLVFELFVKCHGIELEEKNNLVIQYPKQNDI
jgi:hypothetical protein